MTSYMSRVFIRIGLGAAALVAVAVAGGALNTLGPADPTTWATLAAVLAVLAAVTSAWTSQRVVELQEDVIESNPVPTFDLRSRYDLAQLRVTNRGGSPAYAIAITWDAALRDEDGREVVLGGDNKIPVLPAGETASICLGTAHGFLAKTPDTIRYGVISFANASGRHRSKRFMISAEHERRALIHDQELPRTQYELQRIPVELKRIADALTGADRGHRQEGDKTS
ncbi:MAG: hypothetical protein HY682_04775 [Chloroflexi bacterium]|nr:hypothetical protein [Chloroflexota bacterium]